MVSFSPVNKYLFIPEKLIVKLTRFRTWQVIVPLDFFTNSVLVKKTNWNLKLMKFNVKIYDESLYFLFPNISPAIVLVRRWRAQFIPSILVLQPIAIKNWERKAQV